MFEKCSAKVTILNHVLLSMYYSQKSKQNLFLTTFSIFFRLNFHSNEIVKISLFRALFLKCSKLTREIQKNLANNPGQLQNYSRQVELLWQNREGIQTRVLEYFDKLGFKK